MKTQLSDEKMQLHCAACWDISAGGLSQKTGSVQTGDSAVIVEEQLGIVASDATVVSAPDSWRRLLRIAALTELSPRNALTENQIIVDFLRGVCRESATLNGQFKDWQSTRRTPWGRFTLRAFPLPDAGGRKASQIGLLFRREEPSSTVFVRATGFSDLSAQQREVAVLLAQGHSNRAIAESLSLSLNTVRYHVKQVYAKLNVNERSAIASKLLLLAHAGLS